MKKNGTNGVRIETGVRNLDALLKGGLPKGTVAVVSGPPGSGKTILAQQICFHNASPKSRVLYFNTLSEPTAKTLNHLSQFQFFDPKKLEQSIEFVDLGGVLRTEGLAQAAKVMMDHVKRVKPAIVVVDSFKAFDDLAKSREEMRKFGYEIAVNLMAWETTALLLGEYAAREVEGGPIFSVVDGLVTIHQREQSGEQQRFIQVSKMRGIDHSRDEHSFIIGQAGIEVYAPRVTISRGDPPTSKKPIPERMQTGISKLDVLLGNGIPIGSSLLIAGVAGTGKTVLGLEFLYRGAMAGEKGIIFSFEETGARLRAAAEGMDFDIDKEIKRGMIEIVFIPQPDIQVERHLLMMRDRVEALKAKRVVVDSISVFLHKVKDPQIAREKTFQLATIVQNAQAVAFLATDIPYGSTLLSRFGVEETVVDGVILLTSTEEAYERQRYLEVYKMRNTAHSKGRHNLTIGPGGLTIFPRYTSESVEKPTVPLDTARRITSGAPGLDSLLGGGLLDRSITLVSGSAGSGKTTLGMQFILEGVRRKEPGLYVALEESPAQILKVAETLGLHMGQAVKKGLAELVFLSNEHVRANQFISILSDKIRKNKTKRLVLDSASHLVTEGLSQEELRQLLYNLAAQFKALGVTSLITLESNEMYSTDTISDGGFSAVADNIILLRYAQVPGAIRPTLAVVKTRGSSHDRGTYFTDIAKGGVRVTEPVDGTVPARAKAPRARGSRRRQ